MGINFEITAHGPVFDGRAQAAVKRFAHHWEEEMGTKGVTWIRAYLPTQYKYLRNPESLGWHKTNHFIPGLYESVIHKLDAGDSVLIHDTPCVYGPWLEGVGSRNAPVTRFPGYHTFRVIAQKLQDVAYINAIAELPPYIEEMNN